MKEKSLIGVFETIEIFMFQRRGQLVRVRLATMKPRASTSTSILSSVSAEMDSLDLLVLNVRDFLMQQDKNDRKYYFETHYSNGNRRYLLSLQLMKIPISSLPSLNFQLHRFPIQSYLTRQESTQAVIMIMRLVSTLYQSQALTNSMSTPAALMRTATGVPKLWWTMFQTHFHYSQTMMAVL